MFVAQPYDIVLILLGLPELVPHERICSHLFSSVVQLALELTLRLLSEPYQGKRALSASSISGSVGRSNIARRVAFLTHLLSGGCASGK